LTKYKECAILKEKELKMTCKEAQNVAERFANFHSLHVTLDELRMALVTLANFYEDVSFAEKQKKLKNRR